MPVSYSICSEVQAERNIRSIEEGYRRNTEKTLRAKRSRNNRGRGMCRPYTQVSKYTTTYKYIIADKYIIAEYIRNQLEEDYSSDQISMKKYMDPFTGNKRKQAKKDSRT